MRGLGPRACISPAAIIVSGLFLLSDVAPGFGSPQVLRLANALSRYLGEPATIIAPAGGPESAAAAERAGVGLIAVATHDPVSTFTGEIEFCLLAARELDHYQPRAVVLCAMLGAGAIARMRYRPEVRLYYGYEHTDGRMPWTERAFARMKGLFQLAIFPEPHRAALDAPRLSLDATPIHIRLNSVSPLAPPRAAGARNGRAFYGGLIHPVHTYGNALFGRTFADIPLDIYGRMEGFEDPAATLDQLNESGSSVTYHGRVPADSRYHATLASAATAIIAWAPLSEHTYFACPNKFFEAIALGVPPVTTPHPQPARIIARFGCGVVAEDFTPAALRRAVLETLDSQGGPHFEQLVSACLAQAQPALSPEVQDAALFEALDSVGCRQAPH